MHTMTQGMGMAPGAGMGSGMGMAPGMGHGGGAWAWWMGGWGALTIVLVVLALAALVGWIAARSSSGRRETVEHDRSEPVAILRERFARGDIDVDEFDARRRALADTDR